MKKWILLALIFVAWTGTTQAATYWVSTSGNDANNGTASTTPWAHHPWDLNNAVGVSAGTTLQADDIVYMKKGDTWYNAYIYPDNAGSEGHPIITTTKSDWGTGEAIISGAANPESLTWAADGSSYKATVTVAAEPKIVVYNSTRLTWHDGVTSSVGLNEWDWNANTLWVNVGEDPSGKVKVAILNQPLYVSNVAAGNLTFSNLSFEYANSNAVFNNGKSNIVFDNLNVRKFTSIGIYQYNATGGQVTNSTISNDQAGTASSHGIYSNAMPGIVIDRNTVNNVRGNGIYLNATANGQVSNNIVTSNINGGISLSDSSSNNIYLNEVGQNGTGYYGSGGGGPGIVIGGTSSSNNIYRNNVYSNYLGIYNSVSGGTGGNKIYYNLVRDSTNNSIDSQNDPGVNAVENYNNTIKHNPDPDGHSSPPTSGHALSTQTSAKKSKNANNLMSMICSNIYCHGLAIADTGSNIVQVAADYNMTHAASPTQDGSASRLNSTTYAFADFDLWKAAVQADAKITDLNGVSTAAESHSFVGDPKYADMDGGNYQLTALSPAIDAGTDVGLTTDYLGNPIYGAPDIGAYEYQPPYTMTNDMATSSVRAYGDEKWRITTATTSPDVADLDVTIDGADRTKWLDVDISNWENSGSYQKTFTASTTEDVAATFTVGDLVAGRPYTLTIDGGTPETLTADGSGKISFSYSGPWSTHTFDVIGDTTGPTRSAGSPSTQQPAGTNQATLSLTTEEAATCKYSTTANTAYASMTDTFTTTGATTHTTTVSNLQNGTTYTYYVRCSDTSDNLNDTDYTISFSVASPRSVGSQASTQTFAPVIPVANQATVQELRATLLTLLQQLIQLLTEELKLRRV